MRWSPDTCGCSFDFEPDDINHNNQIHLGVITTCSAHSGLSGEQLHQVVLKENQSKNKIHGQLLAIPELTQLVSQSDGSIVTKFKPGIDFEPIWSGKDDSRVLNIMVIGYSLTAQNKSDIQSFIDTKLDSKKVSIQ